MKKFNYLLMLLTLFGGSIVKAQLALTVNVTQANCFGDCAQYSISTNAGPNISIVVTDQNLYLKTTMVTATDICVPSGTYTATATNSSSGTTQSSTFQIIAPSQLVATLVSTTPATSATANNAIATVNITGGTAPYIGSYFYSPLGSSTSSMPVTNTITGLIGGTTYTVGLLDANNCLVNLIVPTTIANSPQPLSSNFLLDPVIVSPGLPTYVPNPEDPSGFMFGPVLKLCWNQSALFTVPAIYQNVGVTYQWTSNYLNLPGETAPTFNLFGGYVPNSYILANGNIFSIIGCTITSNGTNYYSKPDTILVDTTCYLQPINVFTTFVNNGCNGIATGSAIADASNYTGIMQYTISPNVGLQLNPGEFTNLPIGSYIITGTDANSITASTTLIIGSGSSVIVTATNNIVCTGSNLPLSATAVATGGNAPILIDWFYNGNVQVGSGPNYSPATPGQLLVYAEDADGCWDTAFVYIDYTLSSINTPTNITKCGFYTLPWGQIATTTGTYNNVYLNAAGCDSNVIFNVTITGISFTGKVFLHNASIALGLDQVPNTFSLMRDNLRTLGLIPLSSPYTLNTTNNPYSPVFTMVNAPVETTTAAVLAVSGNNAIVDWVFLELRNASNSSTVLYTRSALLQRDGDIVDMDGTSPVNFCTASIGNYFVAIRHRNHLGVMTATTRFFNSSANVDFTSISTPLFLKLAPNNNPSPFNGAAEVKFGMRFLYGANCSILSVPESKTVTYNALPTSDRNRLFNRTLGSITIPGYSVYDVNFDGQARYNNLNNDRLTILRMVNSNNAFTIIEQLP